MKKVIDLEEVRAQKAKDAIQPLIEHLGPHRKKGPFVFNYNGEKWHLDTRNNCIRGEPKPHWLLRTTDEAEKIWPFLIGVAIFEIGWAIAKKEVPIVSSLFVAFTIGYKAYSWNEKRKLK